MNTHVYMMRVHVLVLSNNELNLMVNNFSTKDYLDGVTSIKNNIRDTI